VPLRLALLPGVFGSDVFAKQHASFRLCHWHIIQVNVTGLSLILPVRPFNISLFSV
jgi:hypothetical protein